jgi:hypothetical protein
VGVSRSGPCARTKHIAASNKVICMYQDFLDHNELELACDMLEEYSKDHQVSGEFWLALHDAAITMQLPKAKRYDGNAGSAYGSKRI